MIAVLALLLLAQTQKGPAPAAPRSFAQISKQADQAREQEHLEDAIRLYRAGVRLRPDWAEGWWYLGTIFYDEDRYAEGQTALRRFTALDSKVAQAWALLGLCEFETKAYDEALAHLKRARTMGLGGRAQLDTVTQYHAALLLTRSEQYEEALQILLGFAVRGEETAAVVEAAGIAALRRPLLPNDVPGSDRELVLQVGHAVMDTGARRPRDAAEKFESLLAVYPKTPNLHYLYGSFLLLSDPDAGLRELNKELEISPRSAPALLQIALEYLKRGDAAAAIPYAQRGADVEPRSFVAHNALGRALVDSGDLENGIRELERSKELAPGSPQTRVALASAYAKAGRHGDAARERAEFLKLKKLGDKPSDQ